MEIKPGWKSTEFWYNAIATILGITLASGAFTAGGLVAQIAGGALAVLSNLGYTGSRSGIKKEQIKKAPDVTGTPTP